MNMPIANGNKFETRFNGDDGLPWVVSADNDKMVWLGYAGDDREEDDVFLGVTVETAARLGIALLYAASMSRQIAGLTTRIQP